VVSDGSRVTQLAPRDPESARWSRSRIPKALDGPGTGTYETCQSLRSHRIRPPPIGVQSPPPTFGSAQRAAVEAEIRQRLTDYAAAVTSKDLAGILRLWSDSVIFAEDGTILGGFEAWAPIARQAKGR